jgi:hypothetical protein
MAEGGALIDNRTELPDGEVIQAVKSFFIEQASMLGSTPSTFQTYAAQGGLLARPKFETPANVYDEIRFARDLAERDDDVAAAMRSITDASDPLRRRVATQRRRPASTIDDDGCPARRARTGKLPLPRGCELPGSRASGARLGRLASVSPWRRADARSHAEGVARWAPDRIGSRRSVAWIRALGVYEAAAAPVRRKE